MMPTLQRLWKRVFAGWMRFAHVLGVVNTTILLSVVYILMILPLRVGMFLLRKDPLRIRTFASGTSWIKRSEERPDLDERSHPF